MENFLNIDRAEAEMAEYCIDQGETEAEMARLGIKTKDEYLNYYFDCENKAYERRREDELFKGSHTAF